jgi:predicted nucleic acid-binding protein
MAYLLDTCALSEFTKPKPSASVDAWFAQVPDGTAFVSVLTLGELEKGIAKLTTSQRRALLERWFGDLRDRFSGRVLAVDEPVALEWGRIAARSELAGSPVPAEEHDPSLVGNRKELVEDVHLASPEKQDLDTAVERMPRPPTYLGVRLDHLDRACELALEQPRRGGAVLGPPARDPLHRCVGRRSHPHRAAGHRTSGTAEEGEQFGCRNDSSSAVILNATADPLHLLLIEFVLGL